MVQMFPVLTGNQSFFYPSRFRKFWFVAIVSGFCQEPFTGFSLFG